MMKTKTSYIRFLMPFLLALGVLLTFSACDQDVQLDIDRSVNVFKPGPKFPNVRKLTPAQKQVYSTMGRPDCFQVLYDQEGTIKMRSTLEKELKGKKPKELPPYAWVYLKQNVEIVFEGDSYVQRPLTQRLRLIIQYGDPEDVKQGYNNETQWTWYSAGKMFKLHGDQIIETKEFPAMGTFLK